MVVGWCSLLENEHPPVSRSKCNSIKTSEQENVSYTAEFAGKDKDASLKQHAGVELEQVPHIYCYDQLR